jgi:hypothetical protein
MSALSCHVGTGYFEDVFRVGSVLDNIKMPDKSAESDSSQYRHTVGQYWGLELAGWSY